MLVPVLQKRICSWFASVPSNGSFGVVMFQKTTADKFRCLRIFIEFRSYVVFLFYEIRCIPSKKIKKQMGRPPSAAAPLGLCFWLSYIINISGYSLYIPCIFHIYFLAMFHIFSLVCFLIYGVKSTSGLERMTSFGQISHALGPKLSFWGNFHMVLHGFAWF